MTHGRDAVAASTVDEADVDLACGAPVPENPIGRTEITGSASKY